MRSALLTAAEHYREAQQISLRALAELREVWGSAPPNDFAQWHIDNADLIVELMSAAQAEAAAAGAGSVESALEEADPAPPTVADVVIEMLVGIASDGRDLEGLMRSPSIRAQAAVEQGSSRWQAWMETGRSALDMIATTQIADAGRVSAGLAIATRPGVGYVRYLAPPSCSRCILLAGRRYRWSAGFSRHPRCDCRHWAVLDRDEPPAGFVLDPAEYYQSLTLAERRETFGARAVEAIETGGDLNQIVNARRRLAAGGLTTAEGTTSRGIGGQAMRTAGIDPSRRPRLMPEAIYRHANGDRDVALKMLADYGYIVERPGGTTTVIDASTDVIDLDELLDTTQQVAAEPAGLVSAATRKVIADSRASLPADWSAWRDAGGQLPRDANGNALVPEALDRHLDSVLSSGAAVYDDLIEAFATDAELRSIRRRIAAADELYADIDAPTRARLAAVRDRDAAKLEALRRESAITKNVVTEARGDDPTVVVIQHIDEGSTVTSDHRAKFREAESYYPAAWRTAANRRGELRLATSDRAYYQGGSSEVLAMPEANWTGYTTGMTDYITEVTVHEIAHRMERAIPGLTQLQFALTRRRATRDGAREQLASIYNNPAAASELTLADRWRNVYTGKVYEGSNPEPERHHEVLATGVQELFGRDVTFDSSSELQRFTLGLLVSLR